MSRRSEGGAMPDSNGAEAFARRYIDGLHDVLRELPFAALARVMELLEGALAEQRQVFVAGNGGSAATASHMANDLMKGVAKGGGRGVRAIALSDSVPLITAIANDEDYREVFAGQLAALGQPADLLIVLSASGNSPNIIRVIETAKSLGIGTVGFLGMGGGQAAKLVDVPVIVPSDAYGPVEDVHLVFDHLITAYLRQITGAQTGRGDIRQPVTS